MAASVECRVPFLDHRLVKKVINLPLSYRLRGSTDKWILKEIASRYLPANFVHRKKVGFSLPLDDYLAPLAREELFREGFCLEVLQIQRKGLTETLSTWRHDVEGFFTLLTLELWGRLFFLRQSLDEVTEQVMRLCGQTASLPRLNSRECVDLSRRSKESSAAS
jgi:asparagine synthase (glutamine-hydrolysing)